VVFAGGFAAGARGLPGWRARAAAANPELAAAGHS
jgi:hypothetical protein